MKSAIPPSKISALSSGEYFGMVGDDPHKKIELKAFHARLSDHEAFKKEQDNYKEIPVIKKPDNGIIQRNYLQIKQDVQDIINTEMERILSDPRLSHLVIGKVRD